MSKGYVLRRFARWVIHVPTLLLMTSWAASSYGAAPEALPPSCLPTPVSEYREAFVKFRTPMTATGVNTWMSSQSVPFMQGFPERGTQSASHELQRWYRVLIPAAATRPLSSRPCYTSTRIAGQAALPATDDQVKRLRALPGVEAAEAPVGIQFHYLPNDPLFSSQWALRNSGQSGGTPGADIKAPIAWDQTTGDRAVVIALIDSGVDYGHPDISPNLWRNVNEIAGNGLDDDGNGYIDDVIGYDFVDNDSSPTDSLGHGTNMAGIMAAVGDNALGMAGVAWRTQLMVLKISFAGDGNQMRNAEAINYAINNGAKIIVIGWTANGSSLQLRDAIAAADAAGVLVVAPAGNGYVDVGRQFLEPVVYKFTNLLVTTGTDHFDRFYEVFNYGAFDVDLAAPGVNILSTTTGGNYTEVTGTSGSAAMLGGAAALLFAQRPTRTASQVKTLLLATADTQESLLRRTLSGGRLNIGAAMSCDASQVQVKVIEPMNGFRGTVTYPMTLRAMVHRCAEPLSYTSVTATFANGEAPLTLRDDGTLGDGVANDGIFVATWTPTTVNPNASVTVTAVTSAGTANAVRTGAVSGPYQQSSDANGLLVIEAEHFDGNQAQGAHEWRSLTDANAAGGQAMQATPNSGNTMDRIYLTSSPRLDYVVNFTRSGLHYLWVRGKGAVGDDSLHVGLNGLETPSADRLTNFASTGYVWSRDTEDSAIATLDIAQPGTYVLNVWMREDGMIADKLLVTSNAAFQPSGAGPAESVRSGVAVRINAGGSQYIDGRGNRWAADYAFNTGRVATTTRAIAGTADDPLYQSQRWDAAGAPELNYHVAVPNGSYTLKLHFAEINSAAFAAGKRIFDVRVEGRLRINDLDVFKSAGARRALIRSMPVTVADGFLDIEFRHVVGNPIVQAIELVPAL